MKSFENFTKEKQFDEKQFDEIQKLLNITDDESIYNEIKSLKNEKNQVEHGHLLIKING